MNRRRWRAACLVAVLATVVGCGAPETPRASTSGPEARPAAEPPVAERIVIGFDVEPRVLASTFSPGGAQPSEIYELVSQGLASTDRDDRPVPRLAAELPDLDQGTWVLRPDGGMVTTYRLRDNAFWHDGTPVTMDDLVFSFRVYRDPRVPVVHSGLQAVERLEPQDTHRFVVGWKETYALADRLTIRELTILPRHLLEPLYEADPGALENAPYWTDAFVGTGAYRLAAWQRGTQLELDAFDRYYLGTPKTRRITVRFIGDENTLMAQILADQVDVVAGVSINRAAALGPQLRQAGTGDFLLSAGAPRQWVFQTNLANNPAAAPFREPRVRQAMIHALDRAQLAEFGTAGLGGPIDTWIAPDEPRYAAAEPAITRYPHDARRALALLEEVGWVRGGDGMLRDASGQALACELRGNSQAALDLIAIGAQMWRAVGVETTEARVPPSLVNDNQYRATYPCIEDTARPGLSFYPQFQSTSIRSAASGWRGMNRAGWSHPEVDDAIDRLLGSPRESDRLAAERDMVRVISREAPLIFVHLTLSGMFIHRGLTGAADKRGLWADGAFTWNVHLWERR